MNIRNYPQKIIENFDLIGLENLSVQNMIKNKRLSPQHKPNIMVKTY